MNYTTLQEFTNQYSLSKTLRFELKPIRKTLKNIHRKGLMWLQQIHEFEGKD